MSTTAGPILSVEGLHVKYGLFEGVCGVSFEVGAGEAVCLLGGNGAGKTTSLRAILGALPIAAGRVCFLGEGGRGEPHPIGRGAVGGAAADGRDRARADGPAAAAHARRALARPRAGRRRAGL